MLMRRQRIGRAHVPIGTVGERGASRNRLPRLLGRVAEWQTRWLQVPVSFGTWGFKSPFAHKSKRGGSPITGDSPRFLESPEMPFDTATGARCIRYRGR